MNKKQKVVEAKNIIKGEDKKMKKQTRLIVESTKELKTEEIRDLLVGETRELTSEILRAAEDRLVWHDKGAE
jgi:hypothetical protein